MSKEKFLSIIKEVFENDFDKACTMLSIGVNEMESTFKKEGEVELAKIYCEKYIDILKARYKE